jgi:hypothetical protein
MSESLSQPTVSTLQVIDSAQKVFGFLAGLASVSYLMGWIYSRDYWRSFHAPWVLDLLSPTQMITDVIALVATIGIGASLTLVGPLWNARELILWRWLITLLVLTFVAFSISFLPDWVVAGSMSRTIYEYAPKILMLAAGIGIGLIIKLLQQSKATWSNTLMLLFTIVFIDSITQAPSMLAEARAGQDSRPESSKLDVVTWPNHTDGDWRLGRVVDKGFIVIKLTPDPDVSEVRLLPYSEAILIRPVNQRIM